MIEFKVHHTDVAEAFDTVAPGFESTFENEVTARIRKIVYDVLRPLLPRAASILDINCGIGLDAFALASDGHSVTGVDVSPGMIAQANKRKSRYPDLKTRFLVSSFDDLSSLEGRKFSLALSNFGGLNCTESLHGVFREVAKATSPKGYFLGVIMPRVCPWEIASGIVRLRPSLAFRRFRRGVRATGFEQHSFNVYYHPLSELLSSASPWFEQVTVRGISLLSPPPHAQSFRNRFPQFSGMLDGLDDRIGSLPLLRGMGDHYLALLQRNLTPIEGSESSHD